VFAARRSVSSGNNLLPSIISISGTRFPQDVSTLHALYHSWITKLLTKRKDLGYAICVTYLGLTHMVDIGNHEDSLKELSKTSLINNATVILCWSAAEAARYLELYKS
jgi:hypothetical protein